MSLNVSGDFIDKTKSLSRIFVFFDSSGKLLPKNVGRRHLLSYNIFAMDIEEKKCICYFESYPYIRDLRGVQ